MIRLILILSIGMIYIILPFKVNCQLNNTLISEFKVKLKYANQDSVKAQIHHQLSLEYTLYDKIASIEHEKLALKYCEKCREDTKYEIIQSLIAMYSEIGSFSEGVAVAIKSINEFKKSSSHYYLPYIYNDLARLYAYKEDYKKSSYYGSISIDLAKKGNSYKIAFFLANEGARQIRNKNYVGGLSLLKEGRKFVDKCPDCADNCNLLIDAFSGCSYIYLSEMDSAKYYLQKADIRLKKINHPEFQMVMWEFWSAFFEEKGNYLLAKNYIDSTLNLSIQDKHTRFEIIALKSLIRIAKKNGDNLLALNYLNRLGTIKDSLNRNSMQNLEELIQLNLDLKTKDLKAESDKMKSNFKIKQTNFEKNRLFLIILLLLCFVVIVFLILQSRVRNANIKNKQLELHQMTLELALQKKANDLSNNVIRIAYMNTFMEDIQKELERNKEDLQSEQLKKMNRLIKRIKSNANNNIWNEFEILFEDAHTDFYRKLNLDFPNLSTNERRLCAFMKLNMTSKEIAEITGQSVHSINIARGRLRKKIGLVQNKSSITNFLNQF